MYFFAVISQKGNSGGEWPENELLASQLDYALGFDRAPPTVMRNFTASFFKNLINKNSILGKLDSKNVVMEQLISTCSDNGIFYGAMIGWYERLKLIKHYVLIFIYKKGS